MLSSPKHYAFFAETLFPASLPARGLMAMLEVAGREKLFRLDDRYRVMGDGEGLYSLAETFFPTSLPARGLMAVLEVTVREKLFRLGEGGGLRFPVAGLMCEPGNISY